jgi:hypothetical protein
MRNKYDFYPTPSWCYESLDINWSAFETGLEPAKGDGRILNFMESKGILCDWAELQEGRDYLDLEYGPVDLILTNPPFSLALEFIQKALTEADTVIMLLRLNFLGSQKRKAFWVDNTPTALHILSKRPSFTGTGTDSTEYAWFVWDKTLRTEGGIFFI